MGPHASLEAGRSRRGPARAPPARPWPARDGPHVESELGLTGAQLFVLGELAAEPNVSIRRLAERTLTDPSSASVVVARLVARGFVTRRRDPADGRRSVLAVSERGREALGRAPVPYQAKLFAALESLSRPDLRKLRLGLTALLGTELAASAPFFFEDGAAKPRPRRRRARRA